MVNKTHGRPDLLLSLLLLPQSGTPLLFVSWTLVFELFFYAVFAVLLRWLRQSQLAYVLGAWAIAVVAGNLTLNIEQPVLALVFSPLILEFIMGCAVALFLAELGGKAGLVCLVLGGCGFILGSCVPRYVRRAIRMVVAHDRLWTVGRDAGRRGDRRRARWRALLAAAGSDRGRFLFPVPVAHPGPWRRRAGMAAAVSPRLRR